MIGYPVRILRWDGIYVICKVFDPIFIDPRLNGIFFDGDDEVNLDGILLHLPFELPHHSIVLH